MFTGIIDQVGTIERVATTPAGREFRVSCRYEALLPGESIAVNGACLTVRECGDDWFTAAAVATTLERTTMGSWGAGRRINLERALRAGDRLGGHLVQGHVDGIGTVRARRQAGDALLVDVDVPAEVNEVTVLHGSIAVDGVSLTVNDLPEPGIVQLSLIEYTLRQTTLGGLQPGHAVHLEGDVIGRYVQKLLAPHIRAAASRE